MSQLVEKKLLTKLKSKDMGVRLRALKALIDIEPGHQELLKYYPKILLRKSDVKDEFEEQFFFLICNAIKKLGNVVLDLDGSAEAILIESLKVKKKGGFFKKFSKGKSEEDEQGIKMIIVETLAEIGGHDSITHLKTLVKTDQDPILREAARNALEYIDRRMSSPSISSISTNDNEDMASDSTEEVTNILVTESSDGKPKKAIVTEGYYESKISDDDDEEVAVDFNVSEYLIDDAPNPEELLMERRAISLEEDDLENIDENDIVIEENDSEEEEDHISFELPDGVDEEEVISAYLNDEEGGKPIIPPPDEMGLSDGDFGFVEDVKEEDVEKTIMLDVSAEESKSDKHMVEPAKDIPPEYVADEELSSDMLENLKKTFETGAFEQIDDSMDLIDEQAVASLDEDASIEDMEEEAIEEISVEDFDINEDVELEELTHEADDENLDDSEEELSPEEMVNIPPEELEFDESDEYYAEREEPSEPDGPDTDVSESFSDIGEEDSYSLPIDTVNENDAFNDSGEYEAVAADSLDMDDSEDEYAEDADAQGHLTFDISVNTGDSLEETGEEVTPEDTGDDLIEIEIEDSVDEFEQQLLDSFEDSITNEGKSDNDADSHIEESDEEDSQIHDSSEGEHALLDRDNEVDLDEVGIQDINDTDDDEIVVVDEDFVGRQTEPEAIVMEVSETESEEFLVEIDDDTTHENEFLDESSDGDSEVVESVSEQKTVEFISPAVLEKKKSKSKQTLDQELKDLESTVSKPEKKMKSGKKGKKKKDFRETKTKFKVTKTEELPEEKIEDEEVPAISEIDDEDSDLLSGDQVFEELLKEIEDETDGVVEVPSADAGQDDMSQQDQVAVEEDLSSEREDAQESPEDSDDEEQTMEAEKVVKISTEPEEKEYPLEFEHESIEDEIAGDDEMQRDEVVTIPQDSPDSEIVGEMEEQENNGEKDSPLSSHREAEERELPDPYDSLYETGGYNPRDILDSTETHDTGESDARINIVVLGDENEDQERIEELEGDSGEEQEEFLEDYEEIDLEPDDLSAVEGEESEESEMADEIFTESVPESPEEQLPVNTRDSEQESDIEEFSFEQSEEDETDEKMKDSEEELHEEFDDIDTNSEQSAEREDIYWETDEGNSEDPGFFVDGDEHVDENFLGENPDAPLDNSDESDDEVNFEMEDDIEIADDDEGAQPENESFLEKDIEEEIKSLDEEEISFDVSGEEDLEVSIDLDDEFVSSDGDEINSNVDVDQEAADEGIDFNEGPENDDEEVDDFEDLSDDDRPVFEEEMQEEEYEIPLDEDELDDVFTEKNSLKVETDVIATESDRTIIQAKSGISDFVQKQAGDVAVEIDATEVAVSLDDLTIRPRLASSVGQITDLNVSMDEGYVLSLIDGNTSIIDIARISGMGKEHSLKIIKQLIGKKYVEI